MIHKKYKIFYHKTKKKIISNYSHRHLLLFFALIFNIFVIIIVFIVSAMNHDLDLINAKRELFNQPNPTILVDVNEMLDGYPMVEMAPYIARENREVAAFLVAIAKKESGWGTHTPKLNGEECYNYWGFRQKRERMGSGGHTCFDSPEEAVTVVSLRIKDLIKKGHDTPNKMIVWKCGSCNGQARIGSQKWIQDVDMYYQEMIN